MTLRPVKFVVENFFVTFAPFARLTSGGWTEKTFCVFSCIFVAKLGSVKPLTSHTCKLTDAQAAALKELLQARDYKFREVPYARFAAEKDKVNVVFYESGKLVLQGKGTQEFIEFVLE